MITGPVDTLRHGAFQWALRRSRTKLGAPIDEIAPAFPGSAPIIVTGMHRSGTSLLTRVLETLGVFMGAQQGPQTSEARFFAWQNEIFFRLASASWDAPAPLIDALNEERWQREFAHVAESWMTSPWLRAYWGRRWNGGDPSCAHWGWKDPRNGLTLAVWTSVFPQARVINIERDPHAVAKSLRVRSQAFYGSTAGTSLRLMDVEHGIKLHEQYTEATQRNLENIDAGSRFSVRYERLVAEPTETVRALADFCATSHTTADIDRAASLATARPRSAG